MSFEWPGGGFVRYELFALVDKDDPIKKSRPVTIVGSPLASSSSGITHWKKVTGIYDLNEDPDAAKPSVKYDEAQFKSCCGSKKLLVGDWGPRDGMGLGRRRLVQVTMRCPKRGIVNGETLPVALDIDNGSSLAIKSMRLRISERIVIVGRGRNTGAPGER